MSYVCRIVGPAGNERYLGADFAEVEKMDDAIHWPFKADAWDTLELFSMRPEALRLYADVICTESGEIAHYEDETEVMKSSIRTRGHLGSTVDGGIDDADRWPDNVGDSDRWHPRDISGGATDCTPPRYTPEQLREVARRTLMPIDRTKLNALNELIRALGQPDVIPDETKEGPPRMASPDPEDDRTPRQARDGTDI